MIQNRKHVASYLLLRNGIYYFHHRISKNNTRQKHYKSNFIRRSLKTGNYREAIHKARILWLKYNMSENEVLKPEAYEADIKKRADMYSRGKELHRIYDDLDKNDLNIIDEFFAQEFGTSGHTVEYDREAFQLYAETNTQPIHTINQPTVSRTESKPLRHYIDEYIYECQYTYKNWKVGSHGKFSSELYFFCWCMDECPINDVSIDKLKSQYINILSHLPAHIHRYKELKDKDGQLKPIEKIIKYTEKNKLPKLTNTTIKGKLTTVQSFIKWCVTHEYLPDNITKSFAFTRKIKKENNKRHSFNDEDLKKLFNRPEFYEGLHHYKYDFRHWCLLIALYSGMRANEICQLKIKNVIQDKDTNIYYFDITDTDEDQSVKNKSSKRVVPIHRTLINLGFIKFWEHQKKKRNKNELLFIQLTRHESKGNYTQKLLKWFNEKYIYETNVKKRSDNDKVMKSFHSFRHTFIDYEKQNRLDREILEEVVGHSSGRTTHDGYQNKFSLRAKKMEIDKVQYKIEYKKFKVWR